MDAVAGKDVVVVAHMPVGMMILIVHATKVVRTKPSVTAAGTLVSVIGFRKESC